MNKVYRIKTISEYHRVMGLPKPEHPLISVVDYGSIRHNTEQISASVIFDFYSISIKRGGIVGKLKYGQLDYDFDEGVMFFMSPNQVIGVEAGEGVVEPSGWILLIHPDFLWNSSLATTIKKYEFFDYSVHEALFLSDKEETIISNIIQNAQHEYHANIDKFSKQIIIAQIESLLTYAERFYHRQFLTREKANHQILARLENLLADYFNSDNLITKGLPTVQSVANELNVSSNYLSGLLKTLTGQSTQQHIHNKLIEKAKEKLSTTDLSISEIAYELGFEHLPSFSKLFKMKTKLSPIEFRTSFN